MTPAEYKDFEEQLLEEKREMSREWIYPLSRRKAILKDVLEKMIAFRLEAHEVPFIIRLAENPKYDIGLFAGYVDLFAHDCIHILLGRGLLPKDESFVIGYTMGSTQKMPRWRKSLFLFCSKYLYPEGYKFKEEERFVFNMGVIAGSKCKQDLSKFNFKDYLHKTPHEIRGELGINVKFLEECYRVEKNFFPDSEESQRLI